MFRLTGEVLRSVVAKVHLTDIYYIATQYSKIVTKKAKSSDNHMHQNVS